MFLYRLFNFSGLIFLALLILIPFYYYEVKIAFAFVFLLLYGLYFITENLKLPNKTFFYFTLYFTLIGLFSHLVSILNERIHPEAYKYTLPLYCVYPSIAFILINIIPKTFNSIINISRILIFSSLLISIYFIIYYIGTFTGIEIPKIEEDQNFNIDKNGIPEIKSHAISSLIFLIPFNVSELILNKLRKIKSVNSIILLIILIFNFLSLFVTGRRALIIVSFFSFFIIYISLYLFKRKEFLLLLKSQLKYQILFIFILFSVFFYILNFVEVSGKDVFEMVSSSIDFDGDESNLERQYQKNDLLNEFINSPLIGQGHGVVAKAVRDGDKPWRYELSYLELLFHTGLLGFLSYGYGVFWIFSNLIKILRFGSLDWSLAAIPYSIGLFSILLSYTSNPYLNAFDILWTIFIPVFVVINFRRNYFG